jgi:hypothetical protein
MRAFLLSEHAVGLATCALIVFATLGTIIVYGG